MVKSQDSQADVRNATLALAGIVGGLAYALSDDLIFLGANPLGPTPDPAWAQMPMWRFVGSTWVALFATALLGCGYLSLYRMVRETCGSAIRRLTLVGAVGLGGVLLAHFNIGVLAPLVYKAMMASGASEASFVQVEAMLSAALRPLNALIVVFLYTQLVVLVYGVVSWRFGLRRPVLLVVLGMTLILALARLVLFRLFGVTGSTGATESILEGMMYFVPLAYWTGVAQTTRPSRESRRGQTVRRKTR